MKVIPLELYGLVRIQLDMYQDERGYFVERYNRARFEALGLPTEFVQDNHSRSSPNVIRGLHYQVGQGKLIGVVSGHIWDVVVDIRPGSPTFGQSHTEDINEGAGVLLWIPSGFAHGFCVLGDRSADVMYKVDRPWSAQDEGGIRWSDSELGLRWPITDPIVSSKDAVLPGFSAYRMKSHSSPARPAPDALEAEAHPPA